ncbi:hypothetical protein Lesp02_03720 [Lentzea sp. NBRC 105346]|uniref:hypothetical protein n=1 Tax=Lentzea sp. NBRC 105346 TaxID=3032205 RepID=UPI0024A04227|nr:hypothetical protein [Lentzea sp. NBRC 105346]GLZ28182.1 hypothetical protein Lesp02_03720 [Lentzea sp. NBRC 105346]
MSIRTVTALLAAITLAAGCTGVETGGPAPSAPDGAGNTSTGSGTCSRSATPQTCVEWVKTTPATGDQLFATWNEDQSRAVQMLCSAIPDEALQRWLGTGFYRVIEAERSCAIWSDSNELGIELGLYGRNSLSDYLSHYKSDPRTAKDTQELTFGAVPAMRVAIPDDVDGKGRDQEDYTLAPTGNPAKPGVLQIRLVLDPPRGKDRGRAPVNRARLEFREQVATELLKVLFPQR